MDKITIIHSHLWETNSKIMFYEWSDYIVDWGYNRQNMTFAVTLLPGEMNKALDFEFRTHGLSSTFACDQYLVKITNFFPLPT